MAIHACGLALGVFVLWYAPIRWRRRGKRGQNDLSSPDLSPHDHEPINRSDPFFLSRPVAIVLILVGLFAVGDLIGGQLAIEPPVREMEVIATPPSVASRASAEESTAGEGPAKSGPRVLPRRLGLAGGRATIDTERVPMLGDPYAEWVIAEVFDYTCPECRAMHRRLQEARKRYGGQLAVALLPTPMNAACNKYVHEAKPGRELACDYARLALAVWYARPTAFAEYHDWLMEPRDPPPLDAARRRAAQLLGRKPLEAALADSRIDRRIADDAEIYHAVGLGAIPKLLLSRFVLVGAPASTDKLCESLDKFRHASK